MRSSSDPLGGAAFSELDFSLTGFVANEGENLEAHFATLTSSLFEADNSNKSFNAAAYGFEAREYAGVFQFKKNNMLYMGSFGAKR